MMEIKKIILVILILPFVVSCSKEKTISEELVGEWVYERETFNSFSSFEDQDIVGTMKLNEDETGLWTSRNHFNHFSLEWDLQQDDTKIAITKSFVSIPTISPFTTIFDIKRSDEDSFTFTRHIKIESPADTLEDFEQFENIILTRVE